MHKIVKPFFSAALVAICTSLSPAVAQTGSEGIPVKSKIGTAPARAPVGRPAGQAQSIAPDRRLPGVPQAIIKKTVVAAYYCTIEVTLSSMGQVGAPEQRQFTISSLDDGSLVYGGKDPFDSQRRFSLINEGEWRVMKFVGWIEGKEPTDTVYQGESSPLASKWAITPRIQRNTGEFSARSSKTIGPITQTSIYSGTCTGGV